MSSEELVGWRSEESWGDRSREAGVAGEALRRVRGRLPWKQGQQTAKRRGRSVSPPCQVAADGGQEQETGRWATGMGSH